jgi:hypothetical protein
MNVNVACARFDGLCPEHASLSSVAQPHTNGMGGKATPVDVPPITLTRPGLDTPDT